ncbi:hypothetical protein XU18_2631 [Perkinsela sp. CCAP 1560/4]|nr:hypothetical protein XU18_2631 [Perkinsela sp. CCAP 1560/4]|eukprot:KNH06532.1 hypothetical protein XU18_2631 [Perkinsela sp. CCAP 1560/4]
MTLRHEPGKPFYTNKREKKPISVTYDLVVPEASMHQSHFAFLAEIENFLVNKEVNRLVDDPKFLTTAVRSFAHLRCDDSTSDFERFTTRNPSTYNITSRAYMREDTFVNWHRPCGEDLFCVGQNIAASRINSFALSDLVELLGAMMVVRQFVDATLVDAAVCRTLELLDGCLQIPRDVGPGPRYAERYAQYKHVEQTIQMACQIFLVLSLGWRLERRAGTVSD